MEPFQNNSTVVDSNSEPWPNSDSLVKIPHLNNSFEETNPLNLNSEVEIKQEIIDTETVDVSKEDKNLLDVKKIKQDIGHLDTISDVMPIEVKQEVFESENMDFQTSYTDNSAKEEEEFFVEWQEIETRNRSP